MYNVLEKLRANEPLTEKEQAHPRPGPRLRPAPTPRRPRRRRLRRLRLARHPHRRRNPRTPRRPQRRARQRRSLRPHPLAPPRIPKPRRHPIPANVARPCPRPERGHRQPCKAPQPAQRQTSPGPKPSPTASKPSPTSSPNPPNPSPPTTIAARFNNARRSAIAEILETLCTMGHAHRGKSKGNVPALAIYVSRIARPHTLRLTNFLTQFPKPSAHTALQRGPSAPRRSATNCQKQAVSPPMTIPLNDNKAKHPSLRMQMITW